MNHQKAISRTAILLVLLLTVLLVTSCGSSEPTKEAEEKGTPVRTEEPTKATQPEKPGEKAKLNIGMIIDLTGPYSLVVRDVFQGWQDYLADLNEEGGLKGVEIGMLYKDTHFEVPKMHSAYDAIKDDCIAMYFDSSTANDNLKTKADADRMPVLCQGGSPSAIAPPGFLHTYYPLYPDQLGIFVEWFLAQWEGANPPKFAIITTDNPMGRTITIEPCMEYLEEKGLSPVTIQLVPQNPIDVSPHLVQVRDNGADFAFGVLLPHTLVPVALGIPKVPDFNTVFGVANPGQMEYIIAGARDAAEGLIEVRSAVTLESDVLGVREVKALSKKYHDNENPLEAGFGNMYLLGQFALKVILEAISLTLDEKPWDQITSEDVMQYGFNRIESFTGGDMHAPITFTNGRVYGATGSYILRVEGGKLKVVSDVVEAPNISGLLPQ